MAVNVKLGVDLSAFTSGIREGQNIMKGLNAEMKATEAEFKKTGNAEQMLANKTKTLNSQLQVQKGIADQAKQALKAMDEAGVKPTDAAYQKLYATMMNATAGMNEAQAALNSLDATQQQTWLLHSIVVVVNAVDDVDTLVTAHPQQFLVTHHGTYRVVHQWVDVSRQLAVVGTVVEGVEVFALVVGEPGDALLVQIGE
jgi:chromosome segregation ATPase